MDSDMGKLDAKFARAAIDCCKRLHETQQDHTARLDEGRGQARARSKDRLEHVEGKLDLVRVGVEAIHSLLTGLTASETHEDRPGAAPTP